MQSFNLHGAKIIPKMFSLLHYNHIFYMKSKLHWIFTLLFFTHLLSCNTFDDVEIEGLNKNIGYVPEKFVTSNALKDFTLTSPIRISNAGKILLVGRFLLIGEGKEGIHVFDNIIPQDPRAIAFIKIPAITDFLLKNSTLIVSNGDDLVAINVSALDEIAVRGVLPESISTDRAFFSEAKRLEKVFSYPNYPVQRGTYFECADSLTYVTKWKLDSSFANPTCYR